MKWVEIGARRPVERRGHGRAGPVVAAVVATVLCLTGRVLAGVAMFGVAFVALQAMALSPTFARSLTAAVARFGRGIGAVLSTVLLGAVFAVAFLPAATLTAISRRPLRPGPTDEPGSWSEHHRARSTRPTRAFADDRGPVPGTRLGLAFRVAGVLAVLAALDLAAGSVLLRTGVVHGAHGDVRAQQAELWHTAMAAPAIADEPWADAYGESMIELGVDAEAEYVPFLVWGIQEFHSPYVNSTGTERVSYQPPIPPGTRPLQVAFLGGSAMFGLGQRDEHTIPSEFARLADAAGVPVTVHNYGVSGWVAWQEVLHLERLLAHGGRYDLVVVYDGFNDYIVQRSDYSVDPTHSGIAIVRELRAQYRHDHDQDVDLWDGTRGLAEAYRRTSAVALIARELFGDDPTDGDAFNPAATAGTPEEQAGATVEVYGRAKELADDLGRRHHTPVRFFWQAQQQPWPREVLDHLPPGVTDLSGVFDGVEEPLFIDGVHTNELGARLVAEALWDEVGDDLRGQVD